MAVEVKDGWASGDLQGPARAYRIEKHVCPRPSGQDWLPLSSPVNLILHTTEGTTVDGAINTLREKFAAPQWLVGQQRVCQLRPLTAQGASTDASNANGMQVEIVGKSELGLWLPDTDSLAPLVALVAWLDSEGYLSKLERPAELDALPLVLDRMPAASDNYYRRHLGVWPSPGTYGHVDLPQDEHWDPGSFDYPKFFEMVRLLQERDDMTPEQEALLRATADSVRTLLSVVDKILVDLGSLTARNVSYWRGHIRPGLEPPAEPELAQPYNAGREAVHWKPPEVPPKAGRK